MIRTLVQRITIASDSVKLDLDRLALLSAITRNKRWADDVGAHLGTLSLSIPVTLNRRGSELKLVLCDRPQPVLAMAHQFHAMMLREQGKNITELASDAGVSPSYFSRVLRLSFLAPAIVKAILAGQHPPRLTAKHLMRHNALTRAWPAQAAQLGFA
jgi:site-specific DNA recombinase